MFVQVTAPATAEVGTDFPIQAALMYGQKQYENADLQHLVANAVLTNGQDAISVDLSLNGNLFTGNVKLPSEGNWDVYVTVRSDKTFNRTSDAPVTVQVSAATPAATKPTSTTTPPPAREPIPLWIIILIVAVVVIAIAAGIFIFSYTKGVPSYNDIPNITIQIIYSNDMSRVWQIGLSARVLFKSFSARKKGISLLDAVDGYCKASPAAPKISDPCRDLFRQITLKVAAGSRSRSRGATQNTSGYDVRIIRQTASGTQTATLPASYPVDTTSRINIATKF